jgi:hypothetical protein
MLTHLTGKVSQDEMSVLVIKLYPKHSIRESLLDYSFHFYCFFFSHINSLAYLMNIGYTGVKKNARGQPPPSRGDNLF